MKTKRKHEGGYVVQKYQHVDSQLEKLSAMLYEIEEENERKNINWFKLIVSSLVVTIICIVSLQIAIYSTKTMDMGLVAPILTFVIGMIIWTLFVYVLFKREIVNLEFAYASFFFSTCTAIIFKMTNHLFPYLSLTSNKIMESFGLVRILALLLLGMVFFFAFSMFCLVGMTEEL